MYASIVNPIALHLYQPSPHQLDCWTHLFGNCSLTQRPNIIAMVTLMQNPNPFFSETMPYIISTPTPKVKMNPGKGSLNREFNVTRNTSRFKVGGGVLAVSQLPAPTPSAAVVASVASVAGGIEIVHVVVTPEDPAGPMFANVEIPAGGIVVNDMEEFVEDDIDHQMEGELCLCALALIPSRCCIGRTTPTSPLSNKAENATNLSTRQ
ncbi:hypothetical protein FPQ18DRAFT_309383 [Pyronema domesticum]|nr:hypothetical protein FPQ18DRAFT_309383 [Pyronema domesticum]